MGWIARLLVLSLCVIAPPSALGGVMTQEKLASLFPPPFEVGAEETAVPAWPLRLREGPGGGSLVAYLFESADLAPVPGFGGVPINMLIALRPDGTFMEVRVLSQHEPVFLDGLGEEPLFQFLRQYADKSLYQGIKVGTSIDRQRASGKRAILDGVSKATASVRIINESVLASAVQVARAELGFTGADPGAVATLRTDRFEPLTWLALLDRGLVRHLHLPNGEVSRAFAGTAVAGVDEAAAADPDGPFIDLFVAHLNVPLVGRNLFGEARYAELMTRFWDRQNVLLVMSSGRYDFMPEDYVPGAVPQRLSLNQKGLPLEMRDSGYDDVRPTLADLPAIGRARLFEVPFVAGLDPAEPWTLTLEVAREKGLIYPERVVKGFPLEYHLPADLVVRNETAGAPPWLALWRERALDIGIVAAALVLLAVALARQRWLAASTRRLRRFRLAYLAFTLGFVGWYAQGQLSIVNLTALLNALTGGGDLTYLLYDPITLLLWIFVLGTLVVWGRGTFCGWLCPFGALQEFIAEVATRLHLPQWRPPERTVRRLEWIKYLLLLFIVIAALAHFGAETLAEVEPFKTAITLGFQRSTPFVIYALLTLGVSLFFYKGYCRFLCPLGAGLAVLGKVRVWDWLKRRPECGTPCQLCRHRCAYDAIDRSGAVRYDDCFQCLDCVVIYQDEEQCVPLVQARRKKRTRPAGRAVT